MSRSHRKTLFGLLPLQTEIELILYGSCSAYGTNSEKRYYRPKSRRKK